MDNFKLQGTEVVPSIDFDAEKGLLKISGRMVSISAIEYSYFGPLLKWVNEYVLNPAKRTTLDFHMEYCSSGGMMIIHQVLKIFDDLYKSGHDATVIWNYSEDDEETEEKGFEFQELFKLPINLVSHLHEP
jgi:hypothetical protein